MTNSCLFPYAHATHPQWHMAAALALAQLKAQMAQPVYAANPSLGVLYLTDHLAPHAQDMLDFLADELPGVNDWVGTVGIGICANGVEYFDEPALAIMLCNMAPEDYRVFSGVQPLPTTQGADGFVPHTALVHADGQTPDVAELIDELAQRTQSGYVFGGLASSRGPVLQWARSSRGAVAGQGASGAAGVFAGGLSGVAFGAGVSWVSRVTQGVQPVAPEHQVTEVDHNVLLQLDQADALDVLLNDLDISLEDPQPAVAKLRRTLVAVRQPADAYEPGPRSHKSLAPLGEDVVVRHLIGLDPGRRGVAVADLVSQGAHIRFCERNTQAAKADLVRICAEIREELEPQEQSYELATALAGSEAESSPHPARRIAGAIYVSCSGRGGPHFGQPSAELQIVRKALGDVPLVGFFAGGEIAHHRLYGYTGVLTVFVA